MYIHAYQSYVWNAIVSERIRTYGCDRPIVGDLVFETTKAAADMDVDVENETSVIDDGLEDLSDFSLTILLSGITNNMCSVQSSTNDKKTRKPYVAPRVRTLTEDDLDNYTIFDVIMPLPGTDVAYPGGKLGERYREFLRMDGLDPDNFVRKQRWSCIYFSYIHN
jgi:tRNA pseudouridine13 synthase